MKKFFVFIHILLFAVNHDPVHALELASQNGIGLSVTPFAPSINLDDDCDAGIETMHIECCIQCAKNQAWSNVLAVEGLPPILASKANSLWCIDAGSELFKKYVLPLKWYLEEPLNEPRQEDKELKFEECPPSFGEGEWKLSLNKKTISHICQAMAQNYKDSTILKDLKDARTNIERRTAMKSVLQFVQTELQQCIPEKRKICISKPKNVTFYKNERMYGAKVTFDLVFCSKKGNARIPLSLTTTFSR